MFALSCALWLAGGCSPLRAQQRPDTTRQRPGTLRQRSDTTRPRIDTVGPRLERQPPLSPRRAFLYSFALPGYSQSILGRPRAGTLQLTFEAIAITMLRLSAAEVREAKQISADSIPVSFVDPSTNLPKIRYERTPFPSGLLKSRQSHLEDWIAVLIANHLFSAADAYVAALLWDLPSEIVVRASPGATVLAIRVPW